MTSSFSEAFLKEHAGFTVIRSNEYTRCQKPRLPFEDMDCSCTVTSGDCHVCTDETCINRGTNIECMANCNGGNLCRNQRFQKREYVNVEPFKTQNKGWGLRAKEAVPADTFIMEYVGEVINENEVFSRKADRMRNGDDHLYFMALTPGLFLDAAKRGNIARFVNHSCEPNSRLEKWQVGKEIRMGMFSSQPLQPGDEITFDYKWQQSSDTKQQKCYCGAPSCRGVIGARPLPGASEAQARANALAAEREEKRLQLYIDNRLENLLLAGHFLDNKVPLKECCYVCSKDDRVDDILLCDGIDCHFECHWQCVENLNAVPEGDWYCKYCVIEGKNHRKTFSSTTGVVRKPRGRKSSKLTQKQKSSSSGFLGLRKGQSSKYSKLSMLDSIFSLNNSTFNSYSKDTDVTFRSIRPSVKLYLKLAEIENAFGRQLNTGDACKRFRCARVNSKR